LGYTFQGEQSQDRQFSHVWTKVMPGKGFHDRMRDAENPRRYFIRYRSLPDWVGQHFSFVGKICSDNGATNNVEVNAVKIADHSRGIYSTKYFCNPAWNTIKFGTGYDVWPWVASAEWLLPQDQARDILSKALPEYYGLEQNEKRNLTAIERTKLCAIVQSHLPKGEIL
jgi:hypothetical protein